MNDSKKCEKSSGILFFIFDTNEIKYSLIAKQAIRLIRKSHNIPITIVTDKNTVIDADVNIIKLEDNPMYISNTRFNFRTNTQLDWKNLGRCLAYELSPYDNTILLDVDYLILRDLPVIPSYIAGPMMHRENVYIDITDAWDTLSTKMGPYSIPHIWATVCVFSRNIDCRMFFTHLQTIQKYYDFYCKLYNINSTQFRNDYTFTIADNAINGHSSEHGYYYQDPIQTIKYPIENLEHKDGQIIVKNMHQAFVLPRMNLHIQDKQYLMGDDFKKFVDRYVVE